MAVSTLAAEVSPKIKVQVPAELEDLVPSFLANRRKDIDAVQRALLEGDMETIRVIGHNMQGLGRAYGFDAITDLGAQLQQASRAGGEEGIQEIAGRIADYIANVEVSAPGRETPR